MKKAYLLPLLVMVVTSCGGNNPSFRSESSSITSSEDTSSEISSSVTSSELSFSETSEDVKKTTLENIKQAIDHLMDSNGQINKRSVSVIKQDAFLSDQGYFTMETKTDGVSKRYVYEDRPLVETISQAYLYDDAHEKYNLVQTLNSQSSYKDNKFYTVNVYDDPTVEDYKELYAYNAKFTETFLNLGFGYIEGKVLEEFSKFVGIKDTKTEILGVENYKENGKWNLSYKLEVYAPGTKTIQQTIVYNDVITLTNGVITHVEQEMANQLYVQKEVARSMITNSTFDFEVGEYQIFTGKYLDPANYSEAKK